jgi:cytochrome P460
MIHLRSKTLKSSAFLLACIFTVAFSQGEANREIDGPKKGVSVSDVKEYRKMFRVNEKPIDMVVETAFMCSLPSMVYGPHYDPGVVYYINEIARRGLKTYSEKKRFPVGSIIVKEKQERRTEDSVRIITVMKKASSKSSEDSWDYKMYDTGNWTEIDISKQKSDLINKGCIECHRQYKNNDYISDRGIALLLGTPLLKK